MAATPSNMVPLGTKAPQFSLPDTVSGEQVMLPLPGSAIGSVVMFICNHCPFVKHVQQELVNLGHEYGKKGISFFAISANDADNYPEDAPDKMKVLASELEFPFPYLYDETQKTARAYGAACTPDFFVFDGDSACVYRGQLDDSRPGNGVPVTGKDLRNALDCLLTGKNIPPQQKPSMGCNIKWKAH